MSINKLALLKTTMQEVALKNFLICHKLDIELGSPDKEIPPLLHIRSVGCTSKLPERALYFELSGGGGNTHWKFYVPLSEASTLLSCYFQGACISDLPCELIEAACELWFEHIAEAHQGLGDYHLGGVQIVTTSESSSSGNLACKLQVSEQKNCINVFCVIPRSGFELPLSSGVSKRRHPLPAALPIRFVIGTTHLDIHELEGIEAGDIILIKKSYLSQQHCLVMFCRQLIWLAECDMKSITLKYPWSEQMDNEYSEADDSLGELDEASDAAEVTRKLQDVSLTLSFALPGVEMTIEDVQALSEGYTFQLVDSASTQIAIVVNGSVIGKGQLVNIEGQLGVQVSKWGKNGD
ncbi:type III secretion system cytoplasmic ring protein SctQ [Microbulbifer sp. ZKSA004]|uniref:type III secretion system cytoplasmic ring protein SctQ n=1 Tax=Microbulbifer sp. ZKSA004 TaxID=3243389 RepID=UPI00403A4859